MDGCIYKQNGSYTVMIWMLCLGLPGDRMEQYSQHTSQYTGNNKNYLMLFIWLISLAGTKSNFLI